MQSGAVPTSLSDLILPDPAGDQASGAGTSADPGPDADRFERYLASARRSVATDQPLPTMARADDGGRSPVDTRRDPLDRTSGPGATSSRSSRTERAANDDRSSRPDRGDDRAGADRDDHIERDDGTERVDRADNGDRDDRAERSDDGDRDGATDGVNDGDRAETADQADEEAAEAAAADGSTDDGQTEAEAGAAAVSVDASAEVAELFTGAGDESDQAIVMADTEADLAVGQEEREAQANVAAAQVSAASTHLTSHLDGPSVEATAAVATTDGIDPVDAAGGEPATAIDLDQSDVVEVAASADAGGTTDAETGESDVVAETVDAASTGDEADGGPAADTADGAIDLVDDGPTGARGLRADGPVVTATQARSAGQATRSADGGQTQVSAIDSTGPTVARNRTTTTTTGSAATQGAEGPVLEGDPADPLWLQVRRAMGSLRSLQNGDQQLTIRLRPVELGQVVVRVSAGEQGTSVSLLTDSAVAATQLGQQRQQLISELEQGGLAEVAVDIFNGGATDGAENQAPQDDQQQAGDDGTSGAGAAAALAGATTATLPRTGGRGRRSSGDSSGGLLDVDL